MLVYHHMVRESRAESPAPFADKTGRTGGQNEPWWNMRMGTPQPLRQSQRECVMSRALDSIQLNLLEQAFRSWADEPRRADVRASRKRFLSIFLLIRYTGAKLNEVLLLDPSRDINFARPSVYFRSRRMNAASGLREVPISTALSAELAAMIAAPELSETPDRVFMIDPAFVRRKLYERALACGFSKELGSPEMIRKSRGAELMHGSIPLPAVQKLLGHSTPSLTSSYISFSDEDVRRITEYYLEKETSRKTSARNCFFGKIQRIRRGDIQSLVEIATLEGHTITTVVTNDSIGRLAIIEGTLITAEVKAPWVILQKGEHEPACSAENRLRGIVERINAGKVTTEYVIRISEQSELCSIVTTESSKQMALKKGDAVWMLFNSFAVVLHID